jgi:hypothetical protein
VYRSHLNSLTDSKSVVIAAMENQISEQSNMEMNNHKKDCWQLFYVIVQIIAERLRTQDPPTKLREESKSRMKPH